MRFILNQHLKELDKRVRGCFLKHGDNLEIILKPDTPDDIVLDFIELQTAIKKIYEENDIPLPERKLYVGNHYITDI
jgi:hypothetical protein